MSFKYLLITTQLNQNAQEKYATPANLSSRIMELFLSLAINTSGTNGQLACDVVMLDFSPEIRAILIVRTLIAIIACSVNFRCGYYPQRGTLYPINMRFFASLIYVYRKQNCLHSICFLTFRVLRFVRYHDYIIFLVNHVFINYYCVQVNVLLCLNNEQRMEKGALNGCNYFSF